MAKKVTKTEEEVCTACNGTGRGPIEGVNATTCPVCKGTGK